VTTATKTKAAQAKAIKKGNAIALPRGVAAQFKGFKHTVVEGKKLSRRSYTELPEFAEAAGKK
jgi:hypothetical protein